MTLEAVKEILHERKKSLPFFFLFEINSPSRRQIYFTLIIFLFIGRYDTSPFLIVPGVFR